MADSKRREQGLAKFNEVYCGDLPAPPAGAMPFFDTMIEQLFAGGDGAIRRERSPNFGARAVGRKHDVGRQTPALAVRLDQRRAVMVDADTLLAEAVLDAVSLRRELVEQRVQCRTRDRVDLLRRALTVGEKTLVAGEVVHHAALSHATRGHAGALDMPACTGRSTSHEPHAGSRLQ